MKYKPLISLLDPGLSDAEAGIENSCGTGGGGAGILLFMTTPENVLIYYAAPSSEIRGKKTVN